MLKNMRRKILSIVYKTIILRYPEKVKVFVCETPRTSGIEKRKEIVNLLVWHIAQGLA